MSLKMDDVLTPLHMSGKPVGFATEQAVDTLSVDEKARNRSPSEAELASLKVLCESVAASAQKLGQKVSTVKESYFTKNTTANSGEVIAEDEDAPTVQAEGSMASYLSAIKKTTK